LRELIRTNDAVLLSYVEALLGGSGIRPIVLDTNMSILDGSLGILPRRLVVEDENYERAVTILREAGLGGEIEKKTENR
jgi:Putative prokaryotic signal transducing protein